MRGRATMLAAVVVAAPACGEHVQPRYTVTIIAPSGVDPFASAKRVVLQTAGRRKEISVAPGMPFDVALDGLGLDGDAKNASPIELDAYDDAGLLVAHGRTPPLTREQAVLTAIRLLVQPPGTLGALPAPLKPRRDLAAATAIEGASGLSAVIFGTGASETTGTDGQTTVAPDAALNIWNPITQRVDGTPGAQLTSRRNAAMVALDETGTPGRRVLLFGGESPATPPATGFTIKGDAAIYSLARLSLQTFTKANDRILVSTVADVPRASPAMAVAGDPYALGGRGPAGTLDTVVRIKPAESGAAAFAVLEQRMAAPRLGHTATAVAGGKEILVWGGADAGAPVAEVFQPRATPPVFTAIDAATAGPPRSDHATVLLPSGKVLVAGGIDDGGAALDGGVIYDPDTRTAAVRLALLATARAGACAFVVGNDLVVAGGADGAGNPIGDAEIFDATTLDPVTRVAAIARSHAACALLPDIEAAVVLGGVADAEGRPTNAVEIYQPRR